MRGNLAPYGLGVFLVLGLHFNDNLTCMSLDFTEFPRDILFAYSKNFRSKYILLGVYLGFGAKKLQSEHSLAWQGEPRHPPRLSEKGYLGGDIVLAVVAVIAVAAAN
jgi:hypothetical protein